jgi:hypothetical protein
MHLSIKLLSCLFILGLTLSSCKKDPEIDIIVKGCKDPLADNFNATAEEEDGSCTYQKRFISQYDINVLCGRASAIFQDATMEITSNTKKDRVNFVITSLAGNIIFDGIITKEYVSIDTIIPSLSMKANALLPILPEDLTVKAHITLKSKLTLTDDAKKLEGDMNVTITNAESFFYNGTEVMEGLFLTDNCTFTGSKK